MFTKYVDKLFDAFCLCPHWLIFFIPKGKGRHHLLELPHIILYAKFSSMNFDVFYINFAFAESKGLSLAYVKEHTWCLVEGECSKYGSQFNILDIVHSNVEMEILALWNSFETDFYV